VTPTDECLSLGQKLGLAIGIILRLDVEEGERHYKSKYDVNGDSVIDFDDLAEVVLTPVCKKGRR
jgi:hypothetical protein